MNEHKTHLVEGSYPGRVCYADCPHPIHEAGRKAEAENDRQAAELARFVALKDEIMKELRRAALEYDCESYDTASARVYALIAKIEG